MIDKAEALRYSLDRLCLEPKIYLVGQTAFNYKTMMEWARDNGLEDVAYNEDTPLYNIMNEACNSENGEFNSELFAEFGGRFCYRSWKAGRPTEEYIKNVIESAHNSVLRHMNFTFVIEGVSRSFSHELVRHAAGTAPSQESQRYVDAKNMRFVVPPLFLQMKDVFLGHEEAQEQGISDDEMFRRFFETHALPGLKEYIEMQEIYNAYIKEEVGIDEKSLIKKRANEAARAVLPNCAETRLLFTMNGDAMRHILHLRGDKHADLEIRRFAVALFGKMKDVAPNTLFDFSESNDDFGSTLVKG